MTNPLSTPTPRGVPPLTIRKGCAKCEAAAWADGRCAYCEAMLSPRHEHDHMPVPMRAGGVETVPVCINCHDLKDRVSFLEWDASATMEALRSAPPLMRILNVMLLGEVHALRAQLREMQGGEEE